MTGGLYPAIVQSELDKIRVPVLPLNVQKQIVQTFTSEQARIRRELEESIARAKRETDSRRAARARLSGSGIKESPSIRPAWSDCSSASSPARKQTQRGCGVLVCG